MTYCAVCDKPLKKDEASGKTTHEGVPYYFCTEQCEKKFEAHRVHYIHKVQKAEKATV